MEAVPFENGPVGKGQRVSKKMPSTKAFGGSKVSQAHKSCWNDLAPKNILVALTTLDTFHLDKSWLNNVALANCKYDMLW